MPNWLEKTIYALTEGFCVHPLKKESVNKVFINPSWIFQRTSSVVWQNAAKMFNCEAPEMRCGLQTFTCRRYQLNFQFWMNLLFKWRRDEEMAPPILSAVRMWLTEAGFVLNSCTVTGRRQVKDSEGAGNKAGKIKL